MVCLFSEEEPTNNLKATKSQEEIAVVDQESGSDFAGDPTSQPK
jgi:hypothetical protein